jgi:hypothetical protein
MLPDVNVGPNGWLLDLQQAAWLADELRAAVRAVEQDMGIPPRGLACRAHGPPLSPPCGGGSCCPLLQAADLAEQG